jgi:predicted outer membrane repeat protein
VSNSTLSANSAGQYGGGIYSSDSGVGVVNAIVAGNRGTAGGPDISGTVLGTSSYDLVGDGAGLSGISDGTNHNRIGTAASPLDPRLAPLGYYGGPTPTFALLPGSAARGAGAPAVTDTDQRGQPRLAGPSDVGAFQSQPDPFLVTTLADPGRLTGSLSLREAVALADVLPGDATVSFADDLDGGQITLTAGQLNLSGTGGLEAIDGAGRFTLDGGGATRLVEVDPGTTAVLRGLALLNGNAPVGAGVYNRGTLTMAASVLDGNTGYAGGAILNQGLLTVWGCTLAFNVATLGAAIDNEGMLTAYNSTIGYNAALESGGGIRNDPTGTAVPTSLTISRNSADTGGGLDVADGLVLLRNCIVAGNYTADGSAASDVAGTVDRGSSYDLVGTGGSGGLLDGVNHNQVGVADPGLTTPDFSSAQTPVFGLTSDSPAAGSGDPTLLDDPVLRLDQHGNPRTVVNIGAV